MSFLKKLFQSGELGRMLKFGVTGVANTLVDYLVFALLVKLLAMDAGISQSIAYTAGMLNSYLLNRSWTFRSKDRFFSPQIVRFIVANLAIMALSVWMITLMVSMWAIDALIAKLAITAFTMVINFFISRLWVFR